MESIENKVIEFVEKYNLQDKTVVIGFSGGYDSMCLLDILSKIRDKYTDLNLVAAHFNHNWRGEESLREQEVCRIFAASRGIEFYTKTAAGDVKKTENDARRARYEFFEEAYEEYDADAVFTAHNMDDNAETVLYRIIKGTGIIGLKGISEKRNYFYRPLLKIRRSESESRKPGTYAPAPENKSVNVRSVSAAVYADSEHYRKKRNKQNNFYRHTDNTPLNFISAFIYHAVTLNR